MSPHQIFDVIIIGGGHAGTEAALASARLGAQTLLLTHNIETIGQMSCNPAIGGIGKGHLVKEIDAMGGIMARAADFAGIHFRRLNASKGPAVRATRAQCDRMLYRQIIRETVEQQQDLFVFQQSIDDLILENETIKGVKTSSGLIFYANTVVLTVGTFLAGRIHIGKSNYDGGRAGDPAASTLAQRLREMPFDVGRLKTGTPPRLDGSTIDYSALAEQPGDDPRPVFSFMGSAADHPRQVSCHITATNEQTHDIIRQGLDTSPMYSGEIKGTGPRYCPSVEDKVMRFADKTSHQIFIEPEGLHTTEVYPNGISTSLSFEIQLKMIRSIKGFENVHITRPGYAIEYDFFDPRGLKPSLETKAIKGLFFAGQINGTTGYEEAAAQGLVAGLNAARQHFGRQPWLPARSEAYMGVLIDDLVTRGTLEPYRMFTSRAEYRLLLREDNADLRLTPVARDMGLLDDHRWQRFEIKQKAIEQEQQRLQALNVTPAMFAASTKLEGIRNNIQREGRALDFLRRPEISYHDLMSLAQVGPGVEDDIVAQQIDIQAKYSGYIERQHAEIARLKKHEEHALPGDLDYDQVRGLSNEALQKLGDIRPVTLGQASRIPGITPAAISLLLIHLKKRNAA